MREPVRSYDWARIRTAEGKVYGGAVMKRHEDGTVTISLGGIVPVRGEMLIFVPRNDGLSDARAT